MNTQTDTHAPRASGNRGCLKIALVGVIVLLALGASVAGIGWLIFRSMGESEPVRTAVAQAGAHPQVIAALGRPLQRGFLVSGSIQVNNDEGEAELHVPVSGPRGEGTVFVLGHRRHGRWAYEELNISIDGGADIDLRPGLPAAQRIAPEQPSAEDEAEAAAVLEAAQAISDGSE